MRGLGAVRVRPVLLGVVLLAGTPALPVAHAGPKWDPVPAEQLALAAPAVEPDADAEVLLWTVTVEDELQRTGIVSVRRHFVRVKVFTQKGAQAWSKRDVEFPVNDARVDEVQGRTIRADGTVVEMDRSAVSTATVVKSRRTHVKRVSFALPQVAPGAIVEFRYSERRSDASVYASQYPLQTNVPVHKLVYRFRPVKGVNFLQLVFHAAVSTSRTMTDGYYETVALRQRAFADEPDMPPYWQAVGFMIAYYTVSEALTPDSFWPALGRKVAEWFDAATKPDAALKRVGAEIASGGPGESERVRLAAQWLRANFRIVRSASSDSLAAHGFRPVEDARAAFRQGGGTLMDGLLVFAALLRAAGLETRWVKVPPASEIFFDRNMMLESILSSYQVGVRVGGRWTTLDPATRYLPWDMQLWDEEATLALLCDRDSTRFVETGWSQPDQSVRARRADLELRPDGTLEGSLRVRYSGHLNDGMRSRFEDVPPAERDSIVTSQQAADPSMVRVSDLRLHNPDASTDPLELSARVVFPSFAAVTGRRILLEPAVFYAHQKPRFTSSTRRHPVHFHHPWSELDTIVVRVPEGWEVESSDSVEPLRAPGVAEYDATVMVSDDRRTIRYLRRFRMGVDGSTYFGRGAYAEVKRLFEDVQRRDGISVVVTRPEPRP